MNPSLGRQRETPNRGLLHSLPWDRWRAARDPVMMGRESYLFLLWQQKVRNLERDPAPAWRFEAGDNAHGMSGQGANPLGREAQQLGLDNVTTFGRWPRKAPGRSRPTAPFSPVTPSRHRIYGLG